MRREVSRERLQDLLEEIARSAPGGKHFDVYLVGGGTAVLEGWRNVSLDVDLFAEDEAVFRDIQAIKERLDVNVEFARPEHFVPPLPGSRDRHVHIRTSGTVSFYHYDPYAQAFSKIVRGFERDLDDAEQFIRTGMVEPQRLRELVHAIDEQIYSKYPSLTRSAVTGAVDSFLEKAPS